MSPRRPSHARSTLPFVALLGATALAACAEHVGSTSPPRDAGTPRPAVRVVALTGRPTVVRADATHVYWIEIGQQANGTTTVRRAPRGGGAVETVGEQPGQILTLEVDATGAYFLLGSEIRRARADGSAAVAVRTEVRSEALGVFAGAAFWHANERLVSGSLAGTDVNVLAATQLTSVRIAADADEVFWIERDTWRVMAVDRRGGAPRVLATESCPAADPALDGGAVYWLERHDCGITNDFALRRIPRAGAGAPATIAEHVRAYAVHAGRVYWSDGVGTLHRLDVHGAAAIGSLRDLAPRGMSAPVADAMTADDSDVFAVGFDETRRTGWVARLPLR